MQIEPGEILEDLFIALVHQQRHAGMLVAPDRVHDEKGDEHAAGGDGLHLPKLACPDSGLEDVGEKLEGSRDDFTRVELSEIRELVELADDEPVESAEGRRPDELPIPAHVAVEALGWRPFVELVLALFDGDDGRCADHRLEQLFLIGEVEVDRALGDPGAFGDVLKSGVGQPAFTELLEGGLDDLLGPVLRESLPLWG